MLLILLLSPVYSPSHNPIRFEHAKHPLPCAHCHDAVASVRPGDHLIPPEATCRGCHSKAETGCADCHPQARGEAVPWRTTAPAASLRFGHGPHLKRGARCADCHGAGEPRLPTMAECTKCHQDARCTTCHLSGPDRRLKLALPGGRLMPRDHGPGFKHGSKARLDSKACSACHTERSCERCHSGPIRPLEIHPADYISAHPVEARRDMGECGKCHRVATFCMDCHVRAGVTDRPGRLEFGQRSRTRFHPAGWTDDLGGGAGDHGPEARRNLRSCASCHGEESCMRCHATGAPGGGANPHPPGFRCGRALDAELRGCTKCHPDRRALEQLCAP